MTLGEGLIVEGGFGTDEELTLRDKLAMEEELTLGRSWQFKEQH